MLAKKKNVELRLNHINSNHNNKSNAVSKWKSNRQGLHHKKRKDCKRAHSQLSGTKGQEGELQRIQTKGKEETVEYGYMGIITQKHPRLHQHSSVFSKHANDATLRLMCVFAGSSTSPFA
jgi:hypothetical protein